MPIAVIRESNGLVFHLEAGDAERGAKYRDRQIDDVCVRALNPGTRIDRIENADKRVGLHESACEDCENRG